MALIYTGLGVASIFVGSWMNNPDLAWGGVVAMIIGAAYRLLTDRI